MFSDERPLFRLRCPFGTPIEVQPSLVMLLAFFVLLSGARTPDQLSQVLIVVGLIVLAILLHELGHAWGAWVQGVPVQRVVLYGGGGLCFHARADRRADEFIAAMGPLTNLALWAIFSILAPRVMDAGLETRATDDTLLLAGFYMEVFASFNLFLAVLNLIPIQPLDGGRLLLHALMRHHPPVRATILAGRVGMFACALYPVSMLYALVTFGWIFLFFPSFALHRAMAQGQRVV
ncbi:MAG: site-2 protease family protein [Gemmobacter sp.]